MYVKHRLRDVRHFFFNVTLLSSKHVRPLRSFSEATLQCSTFVKTTHINKISTSRFE